MRTVAGHSEVTDGIPSTAARLYSPSTVATDSAGNAYVADRESNRIRRIDAMGTITTFAGTRARGYRRDGGPATEALLDGPAGVAAELSSQRIRRIDTAGSIATFAGTGDPFDRGDGGLASRAQFSHALGDVAVDTQGNVYLPDSYDHRIRWMDPAGIVMTFAGTGASGFGGDGGPAAEAQLSGPSGVAVSAAGIVYVADTWNHRVRRISAYHLVRRERRDR